VATQPPDGLTTWKARSVSCIEMTTMDDVAHIASTLPGVTGGERYHRRTWFVTREAFAWERPFTKADLQRFADEVPPSGPILAVRVEDLDEKKAVLFASMDGFFTIAHFDGYPAVLIQLDVVTRAALAEAILDAWLACAPPPLATEFLGR
jgi:hypothetical protein